MYRYVFKNATTNAETFRDSFALNPARASLPNGGKDWQPWECWQGNECIWHYDATGRMHHGTRMVPLPAPIPAPSPVYLLQAEHGVIYGRISNLYASLDDANVRAAEAVNEMLTYCRETYDLTGEMWLSDVRADNWRARWEYVEEQAGIDGELPDDWQSAYVEVAKMDVIGAPALSPAEDRAAIMLAALESMVAGSEATGRWLDARGHECSEDEEGATWEEYTEEEQNAWLASVAGIARDAIARVRGRIPENDQPTVSGISAT